MTTIQKVSKHVQALACNYIPKKLRPRFVNGVAALSTSALSSLNANGRSLSENRWTGESRVRRTVTDTRYEWHKIKKLQVARTLFMFVFLGWWLLLKAYGTNSDYPRERKTHPKKRLSWFRTIWEYWQRLRSQPIFFIT